MRPWLTPILLALLAAGAAHAEARPAAVDPCRLFASADTNRDGAVSRAEFLAARAANFETVDRGRKGFLTRDDLMAAAPNLKARAGVMLMFGAFDQDGDGKVTRGEFRAAPAPGFDRADRDHDGVVTRAELARSGVCRR